MLKLKVNTKEFEDVLKKLEVVIPKNPSISILESVKIEVEDNGQLYFTSSDLEDTINANLEVEVISTGSLVLSGIKDIMKSVKFFTEWQTELNQLDLNTLEIINGDKKLKVPIFKVEDYPEFKVKEFVESYEYKENKLYERIMKVNYARLTDNSRPDLTGIHLNKNHLVALDGHRMALSLDDTLCINKSFTITLGTINALRKTLERRKDSNITIKTNDEYIKLIYGNISLTSKLLDCDYFKYEEILPKDNTKLEFDRKELEDNLKFLYIHSKDGKFNMITMELENQICSFKCVTEDSVVSTDLEIESNIEFNQNVNNKFLLDALKVIKSESVNYNITSEFNPLTISDDDSIHLILPVRTIKKRERLKMNKVIGRDYVDGRVTRDLKILRGSRKWELNNKTVTKVKVVNSDERKSVSSGITRGLVGGAVLGPLGMIGGVMSGKNKKSYMVEIYFTDGRVSIAEVDDKIFRQMQIKLKVV